MSHYYDTEYNIEEEKEREMNWCKRCEEKIKEIDNFLLNVAVNSIEIPEVVLSGINNESRKFLSYISESKKKITKADKLLSEGNKFVGWGEW